MTVRSQRLARPAACAAAALLALLLIVPVGGQPAGPTPAPAGAPAAAPTTSPTPTATPASPAAKSTTGPSQKGLPPELVIPYDKLDAQQKELDSLDAYLKTNAPPAGLGGLLNGLTGWISGLTSGQKKPTAVTVSALVPNALQAAGRLVSVEGLYRKTGGKEYLVEGSVQIELGPAPAGATSYQGFPSAGPDGLPALAVGNVEVPPSGPLIRLRQVTPAPTLTLVRLARVCELRDDLANYVKAMELYQRAAASTGPGAAVWQGFAMARGGQLAEEKVRDRKKAINQYQAAWNLQGRAMTRKTPGMVIPQTWVFDDQLGQWQSKTLREAIGQPLDALEKTGFWYRFVDTVVALSGGNAGVGLILLAIITRLLLYPLTKKQLDSAKAMQRLQPQIKALQEKHGKDKQKFQEDFWRLCRDNKVNPFGGCLPLLIQMPLLFLVYQGIRAYTVQLSHHSFLWIHNLADPDMPLLVLYTISMIAFQKLTMKNQPISDPQQQQQQNMMVWMMPLMFFMFFQTIASGFILYWLGTNLIYLPQQYLATRPKGGDAPDDQTKERVVTLEPGKPGSEPPPPSGEGGPPAEPSLLERLRGWVTGQKPVEDEGPKAPPSYEEKKIEEKRRQRRLSRRRRRL